jgi:hypothetical protein
MCTIEMPSKTPKVEQLLVNYKDMQNTNTLQLSTINAKPN